jgi:hypothetical protein
VEDERFPKNLDDLGRNLVHFDLDPSNGLSARGFTSL